MVSTMLSGKDRIEMSTMLGRPMRQGTPEALNISDVQRFRDLINQQNGVAAHEHFEYLIGMHQWMLAGCIEWAWKSADRSEVLLKDCKKPHISGCHDRWKRMSLGIRAIDVEDAFSDVDRILMSRDMTLESATFELFRSVQATYTRTFEAIQNGFWETASMLFEIGVEQARARHDLLICFITAAAGQIADACGEADATSLLHDTMAACAFYEPMWSLIEKCTPLERAAVLAEHLRTHFSGSDREGSVLISENRNEFRIQMNACGSGGALRRELGNETPILKNASSDTWGRAGDVPIYCSHCAHNEAASLAKLGFKAWTTEFNPAADAPCYWVVPKNTSPKE